VVKTPTKKRGTQINRQFAQIKCQMTNKHESSGTIIGNFNPFIE